MKISGAILALCVLYPNVAGTSAFIVQAPQGKATKALQSAYYSPGEGVGLTGSSIPLRTTGGPLNTATGGQTARTSPAKDIWETSNSITVQGGSLRTWSTPSAERIQVLLKTDGRPLNANVELWHGPDNTPQKMSIYIEDGSIRPFCGIIETPRGHNAIAIRNTGQMEFPLYAALVDDVDDELVSITRKTSDSKIIQGGAIQTYAFAPNVASVQVAIRTDGRPLNARIELLQGPNNNKQVIELYTEDGMERPFFMVVETPGSGNVVRVVNTATVEFPMNACVVPYMVDESNSKSDGRGWDNGGSTSTGGNMFLSGGQRPW